MTDEPSHVDNDALAKAERERDRLTTELQRAWRCVRGFHSFSQRGELPDNAFRAYHILTIAAAVRYVSERSMDGSEYFIGKDIDVVKYILDPPKGPKQ